MQVPIEKIISGGQTGVDRAALDAALNLGIPCGGACPKGRRAEDGIIPRKYPLTEMDSPQYPQRTLQNIIDSDATLVIYFSHLQGGTEMTVNLCRQYQKPYLLLDATVTSHEEGLRSLGGFCLRHSVRVLNVAGPRHSKSPQAHEYTFKLVKGLLQQNS